MAIELKSCSHIDSFDYEARKKPLGYECEQCITTGDSWVHLRTCQTCGVTLCCDSSPNKHATQHFKETEHQVIISAEPGEKWAWCYEDEVFKKY